MGQACERSGSIQIAHARQHSPHVGEAGDNARHWIVGMNLIFEIDETRIAYRDQRFEDLAEGQNAVSDGHLISLLLKLARSLTCRS